MCYHFHRFSFWPGILSGWNRRCGSGKANQEEGLVDIPDLNIEVDGRIARHYTGAASFFSESQRGRQKYAGMFTFLHQAKAVLKSTNQLAWSAKVKLQCG